MHLYLLRHGIAEENSATGRDADRELTAEGREKLTDLLRRAGKSGVKPTTILTSPYKRAQQTARLAAKLLGGPDPLETESLIPYSTPASVWSDVRDHADSEEILLASHEPLLSQTVSYLLNAPGLRIEMKKGALVAIEFASLRGEPRGTLRWMLIPRLTT